tara:strand:- start:2823 stop:3557 length:735 start_codon:yes stop_codon:yes gene_type:complete
MDTFLALITAHLLADFLFQNRRMVESKRRIPVLLLHSAIVIVTSIVLLGEVHMPIIISIGVTHFLIDFLKTRSKRDDIWPFLIDQGAHIGILIFLSIIYPYTFNFGFWPGKLSHDLRWFQAAMVLVSGLMLIAPFGGILIGKLVQPLRDEIESEPHGPIQGLRNGGMYIGWLERLLTLLLVMINLPAGIGFLLASKSILRLGEIKNGDQRKTAEYIMIGTFLSFGWALLVSLLVQVSLLFWFPV